MSELTFKGKIVQEWLDKWPELPSLTLARMIYNDGENYKLWTNVDNVRALIRTHRGKIGSAMRKQFHNKKHYK